MQVWCNISLSGTENAWGAEGSRYLKLINTTGKTGKLFNGAFLGCKRINRTHFIFLNKHRMWEYKAVGKECGIWVSECDYDVIGHESFTGKTKSIHNACIIGRFGVYNLETEILCKDRTWKLKEGKGWVICHVEEK
jgi:hypothetical protein